MIDSIIAQYMQNGMQVTQEWSEYSLTTNSMKFMQLECGPMPNLMVALPNIGGALCSTPQSLADAHY